MVDVNLGLSSFFWQKRITLFLLSQKEVALMIKLFHQIEYKLNLREKGRKVIHTFRFHAPPLFHLTKVVYSFLIKLVVLWAFSQFKCSSTTHIIFMYINLIYSFYVSKGISEYCIISSTFNFIYKSAISSFPAIYDVAQYSRT